MKTATIASLLLTAIQYTVATDASSPTTTITWTVVHADQATSISNLTSATASSNTSITPVTSTSTPFSSTPITASASTPGKIYSSTATTTPVQASSKVAAASSGTQDASVASSGDTNILLALVTGSLALIMEAML